MTFLLTSFFIFFILFILLEIALRKRFKTRLNSKAELYNLIAQNKWPPKGTPFEKLYFRFYGKEKEPLIKTNIQLNNQGLISVYDYRPSFDENTFRIAVIGGSQTASTFVKKCWPDYLQDRLNKLMPEKKIEIYNIGWPDLTLKHYLERWRIYGNIFKPHLVLVNLIESDYLRVMIDHDHLHKRKTLVPFNFNPGETAQLQTLWSSYPPPPSTNLIHKKSHLLIPWKLTTSENLLDDSPKITALQMKLIEEYKRRDQRFGYYALAWFCTPEIFPSLLMNNLKRFYLRPINFKESKIISSSFGQVNALKKEMHNVIFIHSLGYTPHQSQKGLLFFTELEKQTGVQLIDMRKFIHPRRKNLKKMYLHPALPGHLSADGHRYYAELLFNFLSNKINIPTIAEIA